MNLNRKNESQPRRSRFAFTIQRDVLLLRTALCKNPWQTGDYKWGKIKEVMKSTCKADISEKSIKGRVNLLLKQYRCQQLQYKTGTEEERSERSRLLESIDLIIQEEQAAINLTYSADQDEFSDLEESDDIPDNQSIECDGTDAILDESCGINKQSKQNSGRPSNRVVDLTQCNSFESDINVDGSSNHVATKSKIQLEDNRDDFAKTVSKTDEVKTIRKKRLVDRKEADTERNKLLDLADEPTMGKKARLSLEDEMIMKRQEHEMQMDTARLEIEKRRETRLEEEGRRRRDDFNMSQLVLQQSILNLVVKLMEK